MADPAAQPVLDLTTDRTRAFVRIDGVGIDLRDSHDLVFRDYKRLDRVGLRLAELEALDTLTNAQTAEYSGLLHEVCELALVNPPKGLLAKLDDAQRAAVARTFFTLLAPSLPQPRASQGNPGAPGGMTFSRGSRASTASRRSRGSRTSR